MNHDDSRPFQAADAGDRVRGVHVRRRLPDARQPGGDLTADRCDDRRAPRCRAGRVAAAPAQGVGRR